MPRLQHNYTEQKPQDLRPFGITFEILKFYEFLELENRNYPMSFLNDVLKAHIEYEPPQRFFYWSSLAAISAVLKDNVWFNMGKNYYQLYPNIYVLLFGPSGVQKGPAINLAKKMVRKLELTRVISGRASIEAILKELGTAFTIPGKGVISDSCGFIVASELSSSIISNTSSLDILTDLFDRQYNEGAWKYLLKVSDSVSLKSPTITWLAGTNEALFREYVPEKNMKGGLVGRVFIISENKKNTINSLMLQDEEFYPDVDQFTERLKPLSELKGEFTMSREVRIEVDEWYKKFWKDVAPSIEDETGTVNRILDSIIRVSMLISCSNRGDLQLLQEDVHEATREVMKLIISSQKTANVPAKNDESLTQKRMMILMYLINKPKGESRVHLLEKFAIRMDNEDLDKTIIWMDQLNILDLSAPGGRPHYRLKFESERVQQFLEKMKK